MKDYDRIYAAQEAYFGAEPSPLLDRFQKHIPAGARILDLGIGQGRNAVPLAGRGLPVTGIDTSQVAVESVRSFAATANLPIEVWHGSFIDYSPADGRFGGVLVFGLLQTLPRSGGASLIHRLREWTQPGSVVFLTAWHVDDPSYATIGATWTCLSLHSYQGPDGEIRTFLGRGEILDLMLGWSIVHHWEGLGPEHRHGDGPPERHGNVELVAVRSEEPRVQASSP
jgi:hypothetical protein